MTAGILFAACALIILYSGSQLSKYGDIAQFVREVVEELHYGHICKRQAYLMYAANALIVIGAATYLPYAGERIAEMTGLGQTFVGSVFVALSTSLPEVVVSFTALRIGAVDMAYGNLLGSNLFNIGILALDDILYTKGPLLAQVSATNTVTAVAAIVMTAIVITGLTFEISEKAFRLAWDSLSLIAVYIIATVLLYAMI